MTPNPTPGDPNQTLDIYDPKNANFVNPNDVLVMRPDDTAAREASFRMDVIQATALRNVQAQIVTLTNDGFLIGYQATREDGSVWQKLSGNTPMGRAYWWECVKGAS